MRNGTTLFYLAFYHQVVYIVSQSPRNVKYTVQVDTSEPFEERCHVSRALQTESQRTDRASFFPINRIGVSEGIAAAAVYLCSDEAGWVSGVTLLVAGGQQATSDICRWVRRVNPVPEDAHM